MLDGASLPMGVLDSLVGRSSTFAHGRRLRCWSVTVPLADGSDWLTAAAALARLGHTPKQAAETVADAAARRAGGKKRDDITVAVLAPPPVTKDPAPRKNAAQGRGQNSFLLAGAEGRRGCPQ